MLPVIYRLAAVVDVRTEVPLTQAECARRDVLVRGADRAAYTAARSLAKECVGGLIGVPVAHIQFAQSCPTCGRDDHGAPRVVGHTEVWVSWSHSTRHVAAIAAYSPCGVDVESQASAVVPATLSARESAWIRRQPDRAAAFTRLWVRKEALLKSGHGTLDRIRDIDAIEGWPANRSAEWGGATAIGAAIW